MKMKFNNFKTPSYISQASCLNGLSNPEVVTPGTSAVLREGPASPVFCCESEYMNEKDFNRSRRAHHTKEVVVPSRKFVGQMVCTTFRSTMRLARRGEITYEYLSSYLITIGKTSQYEFRDKLLRLIVRLKFCDKLLYFKYVKWICTFYRACHLDEHRYRAVSEIVPYFIYSRTNDSHIQLSDDIVAQGALDYVLGVDVAEATDNLKAIREHMDSIASWKDNFGLESKGTRTILQFIFLIVQLLEQSTVVAKMAAVASFLNSVHFAPCHIQYVYGLLTQFIQTLVPGVCVKKEESKLVHDSYSESDLSEEEFEAHSFSDMQFQMVDLIYKVISKDFNINLATFGIKNSWRDVASLTRDVSSIINFVSKAMNFLIEHVIPISIAVRLPFTSISNLSANIKDWMQRVMYIYTHYGAYYASVNYQTAIEITDLMRKGNDYMIEMQKVKPAPAVVQTFTQVYAICKELARETVAFATSGRARPEPLLVFLKGNTAVGKSIVAQILPIEIFARMGIDYDEALDLYRRNEEQDHWDGYKQQKVVCFDDMFQSKDPVDQKNSLLSLLHVKNQLPYPLKMASLSQKDNTWFCSSLVIVTTNYEMARGPPIVSIGAIMRRRDINVEVCLKSEYKDKQGLFDRSKAIKGDSMINPDVWDFKIFESGSEENPNPQLIEVLNWEQFVKLCVDKMQYLTSKVSDVSNYARKIREKYGISHTEVPLTLPPTMAQYSGNDELLLNSGRSPLEIISCLSDLGRAKAQTWYDSTSKFVTTLNTKIASAVTELEGIMQTIIDKIKQHPIYLGAAILGSAAILVALMSLTRTSPPQISSQNMGVSGDETTLKFKKTVKVNKGGLKRLKNQPVAQNFEGLVPSGMESGVLRLFQSNLVTMYFGEKWTHGIALTDACVICPMHSFHDLIKQNDLVVKLFNATGLLCKTTVLQLDIAGDEQMDYMVVKFPRYCPRFRDIRSLFLTDADITKANLGNVILGAIRIDEYTPPTRVLKSCVDAKLNTKVSTYTAKGLDQNLLIETTNLVYYRGSTQYGDCGAAVMLEGRSGSRFILGMHVAGCPAYGYARPITRELIDSFGELLGFTIETPECVAQGAVICPSLDYKNVSFMGFVEPGKEVSYCPNSQITPSQFQGEYYEPYTAPALLRVTKDLNPFEYSVKKQFGGSILFPQELVDMAIEDFSNSFMSLSSKYKEQARLLTHDEIWNGIHEDKWMRKLNLHTSSGYPHILDPRVRTTGKRSFVDIIDEKTVPKQSTCKLIDDLEDKFSKGIIPFLPVIDTLKDERRPIEKVAVGNTRVFNVVPVELNCLIRKYTYFLIAHVMENHIVHEASFGVNPHSQEWLQLFNIMEAKGTNWFGGDYSNYDKTLSWQIIISLLPLFVSFYKGDSKYQRVLEAIFIATFNATHIVGSQCYRVMAGNPSGCALTSVMNSMVNSIYSRIVFLTLQKEYVGKYDITDFGRFVCTKNNGDDNLFCVSDAIPWFNLINTSKAFAKYGITYTSAKKEEVTRPYEDVTEITYLKRRFRREGPLMLAPVDIKVIREVPNWVRRTSMPIEALIMEVESVKKEWMHYGKEVYDVEVRKLNELCWKHGIRSPGTTFEHFRQEFLLA